MRFYGTYLGYFNLYKCSLIINCIENDTRDSIEVWAEECSEIGTEDHTEDYVEVCIGYCTENDYENCTEGKEGIVYDSFLGRDSFNF